MLLQKNDTWLVKASREETEKSARVHAVAETLGLRLPTAQLLVNRGCETPQQAKRFLETRTESLHDPLLMQGI